MLKKKKEAPMERSDGLIDYDIYIMGKREKAANIAVASILLFAIGYVFYHNYIVSAIMMLLAVKWPSIRRRQIIEKRKNQLLLQFKDMMYALASALSVGKSVESGLRDALLDLQVMYPDPDTYILREIEYILRGIGMNITTEEMFRQFADRAHLEDVENFVDIFVTCKRTGGDLMEVMRTTSNVIGEKIEVKQEIETAISGKKYEFQFMMAMPVIMVLFLTLTSGDYMAPVFSDVRGNIAMTVAIIIFGVSYLVGSRIMKISV